jgi:hypothetical protein
MANKREALGKFIDALTLEKLVLGLKSILQAVRRSDVIVDSTHQH